MPKVTDVYKSKKGHVQTVKLYVGYNKCNENDSKCLVCPIHKIQLLLFPDRETDDIYNQDDESY